MLSRTDTYAQLADTFQWRIPAAYNLSLYTHLTLPTKA